MFNEQIATNVWPSAIKIADERRGNITDAVVQVRAMPLESRSSRKPSETDNLSGCLGRFSELVGLGSKPIRVSFLT